MTASLSKTAEHLVLSLDDESYTTTSAGRLGLPSLGLNLCNLVYSYGHSGECSAVITNVLNPVTDTVVAAVCIVVLLLISALEDEGSVDEDEEEEEEE